MSYRLKNSDFRTFLGVLEEKVRYSEVYVGEGIGIYFGVFSVRRKYAPGWDGSAGEVSRNYLLTD